ncbi:MAG: hypothetical protein MI748_20405, partial [Opitutales bacterium]|nr:hypothetical protein [Opitutales bacterium]
MINTSRNLLNTSHAIMLNNKTSSLAHYFEDIVTNVSFSPCGEFLAMSGTGLCGTELFNTRQSFFSLTASPVTHIDKIVRQRRCISFSPSGKLLAVGGTVEDRQELSIYQVGGDWKEVWHTESFEHPIRCCLWASEHQLVTEGDWIDLE